MHDPKPIPVIENSRNNPWHVAAGLFLLVLIPTAFMALGLSPAMVALALHHFFGWIPANDLPIWTIGLLGAGFIMMFVVLGAWEIRNIVRGRQAAAREAGYAPEEARDKIGQARGRA